MSEVARVRLGVTLQLNVPVLTDGDEVSLVGRNISAVIVEPKGAQRIMPFTIDGEHENKVKVVFEGAEQNMTGLHRLMIVENLGKESQTLFDIDAVNLVARSSMASALDSSLPMPVVQLSGGSLFVGGKGGEDGVGISTIQFDSRVEGANRYKITLTNGTMYYFVANDGAQGLQGHTPYIQDGYWFINNTSTGVKADFSAEEAARAAAETQRQAQEAQRQQTFATNEAARQTAYQNAEANRDGAYQEAESDRDDLFTAAETQRNASVTAAQTAAQAAAASAADAADDAAEAAQKLATIQSAIDDLDPSQSTDDAVVALAARQGVLEGDIAALGPKIDQIYPDVIQMREAFSSQIPLDSVELMARMAVNTSKVEPSNNTYTSAYEVKAGRKYHINASIIWTNATIGAIGFVAGELPSAATACTILNAFEVKTYSEDYVPSENGYILLTHQINSNVYLTSGEVLGVAYVDYSARINNLATKVSSVVDKNYEYSVAIPSAEAKNTISAGQRCDIDDVAPGESITINITRGGGMANKNLRIWFCTEPNSQSSSDYAQLEVSASENSVTWQNTKSVAIKSIAVYVYADETRVTDGTLSLDIILAGRTSKALAAANNAMTMVNGLSTEVTELDGKVESVQEMTTGIEYEYSADIPAVNSKNTNSAGQRLDISEVRTGRKLNISISRSGGMVGKTVRIWYCSEPNSQSTSTYNYVDYAGNVNEVEYTNNQSYSIKSIAIYVYNDESRTTDGNVTLEINTQGVIENHEERITALEGTTEAKVTLTDVLYHWMNGEKYPIGFHGDSTTDGVATTGWSVSNSHPAQDEAEGGTGARGVVDYICQLAYPYILEKMLQSELGNNNLRVYNIGYYGASLINNYSQLSAIYADVYADVKMVGLTLSINDRGSYSSDAEYYAGLVTKLGQYVDFYLGKGITPFMVTQQVVTQNGNDPNLAQYGVMYQNHVQEISNLAKRYVAKKYDLEVIDMNEFGRLLMKASSYAYTDLTEDLHFKDLGHRLEAGFLFSELVPWVNKSGDAKTIYFGFNCANNKTGFRCGNVDAATTDKFKYQINYTRSGDTSNVLVFDAYMFVNSKDGAYNVKYLTPRASGYIVLDGDTSNPITIDSTEMTLQPWDIGLHHVQVYTGASEYVAFKGFLLEQ